MIMKTIALFCTAIMVAVGCWNAFTGDFVAGSVVMIIGALAMLIIAPRWEGKR